MSCILKSKIHRASVTGASVDYEGSLTIAADLAERVGLRSYERILVGNLSNGERFETYVILGEEGSGQICLNGACARLAQVEDKIIIIAYCYLDAEESKQHKPTAVFVDDDNTITSVEAA